MFKQNTYTLLIFYPKKKKQQKKKNNNKKQNKKKKKQQQQTNEQTKKMKMKYLCTKRQFEQPYWTPSGFAPGLNLVTCIAQN